jgi:drug/metabolite transporter (DMT)-like permease
VAVCLTWGTTYAGIRIGIETIPPLLMSSTRWIVAGVLLACILKWRGEPLPPRAAWKSLAVLGVLLVGFGNGAVVWAEQVVPSGLASLLVAVTPFWLLGINQFVPGSVGITRWQVLGLVVGFGGVVFLVWPEVKTGGGALFLAGVAATQVACVGWAIGSNYSRHREDRTVKRTAATVLADSSMQMIFGGVFLFTLGLLRGEARTFDIHTVSARSAGAVVYLGLIGSMVGFSAYAYALQRLPLSLVSMYAYINPIIAVACGALFLSEPVTPRLIVAGALVLSGSLAVTRRGGR